MSSMYTINDLNYLEKQLQSPRDIALLRIQLLEDGDDEGFAARFVPLLQKTVELWLASLAGTTQDGFCEEKKDEDISAFVVHNTYETKTLFRVLRLHVAIAKHDPILAEEVGLQGSHICLSKVIRYDSSLWHQVEEDSDAIMELQDLACEVASSSPKFPLRASPLSINDLKDRLPLCISFDDQHSVLIQQVTTRQSAQEDVGFVLWPSAIALSQWLLSNQDVLQQSTSILELGAGCGLVGLLAAQLQGEFSTILTDFNPVVLENIKLNIELNGVKRTTAQKLDFYKQAGDCSYWIAEDETTPQGQVDLILAADMICQPDDAVAAANSIHDALKDGGTAIVVCANGQHRFGVDIFEQECQRVGLTVTTSPVEVKNTERMHLTAGFVEGMLLTMFKIDKR